MNRGFQFPVDENGHQIWILHSTIKKIPRIKLLPPPLHATVFTLEVKCQVRIFLDIIRENWVELIKRI